MPKSKIPIGEHILIIYELFPESVELFLIPYAQVTKAQLSLLELAHGKYIGTDKRNPGMEFLSDALSDNPKYCSDNTPPEQRCIWHKYRVKDGADPLHANISCVYRSGVVL